MVCCLDILVVDTGRPGEMTMDTPQITDNLKTTLETQAPGDDTVPIMAKMSMLEQLKMYWDFFFVKGEKVPCGPLPAEQVDLIRLRSDSHGLRASWLGHSSVLLNIEGTLILTDPVLTRKVTIVGPSRFAGNLPITPEELPNLDMVIVSHDHYDHLNRPTIEALVGKTALFLVPVGLKKHLTGWGVEAHRVVELTWWQDHQVTPNLRVTATPAQHFSGRGLFDRNKTHWASWVLQSDRYRVFFSGDSGYFRGFREIGRQYGPFDLSLIECGAYSEYWPGVHMSPEQTVQAARDLGTRILQPIHWATFNLALHPWYEPIERMLSSAWQHSVRVSAPKIGEVVDYRRTLRIRPWWQPAMEQSIAAAGRTIESGGLLN